MSSGKREQSRENAKATASEHATRTPSPRRDEASRRQTHVAADSETSPAATARRAAHAPRSLTAHDVLQLQSEMGNRAVGRMLSAHAPGRAESPAQTDDPAAHARAHDDRSAPLQTGEGDSERVRGNDHSPQAQGKANPGGLPATLRADIEHLSGVSLHDAKVHYNSPKPATLRALAYTQGTNVHLAPGQEHHLAHEAWHVVQQKQGRVKPTLQRKSVAINDDGALEREADVMGARAQAARPPARHDDEPHAMRPPVRHDDATHAATDAAASRPRPETEFARAPPSHTTARMPDAAHAGNDASHAGNDSSHAGNDSSIESQGVSGRAVVQGVFTVAPTIGLADVEQEEQEFTPEQVNLVEIQMTDKKRPTTRLLGSQGRHIVAWQAKAEFWKVYFQDKSFEQSIKELYQMALEDEAIDRGAGEAGNAGREMRARLLAKLRDINDKTSKPMSEWMSLMSWALTTYIKAYQQSSFSAFASTNPKGRNEAGHLKHLAEWEEALSNDELPTIKQTAQTGAKKRKGNRGKTVTADESDLTPTDVLARVRGLMDLSAGLPGPVLHKVFTDWLKLIKTLYPTLFDGTASIPAMLVEPEQSEIDKLKTAGYLQVQNLFDQMVGEGEDSTAELDDDEEEEEEATGKEAEKDEELEEDTDADKLRETEPFIVRVMTAPIMEDEAEYEASDLYVWRLSVSDERPPTRFGDKQMSHTIPWSLERLSWVRKFSDKTLDKVIEVLLADVKEEKEWSAAYSAGVKDARKKLESTLKAAKTESKSISVWTSWLSEMIEEYVSLYQRSPFSVFGTEAAKSGASTATGKGEAALLKTFRQWDDALAGGEMGPNDDEVETKAKSLVDVPQLSTNRDIVDVDKLKTRWLAEMGNVFPNVFKKHKAQLEEAYKKVAVQTEHYKKLGELAKEPTTLTRAKRKAENKPLLDSPQNKPAPAPKQDRPPVSKYKVKKPPP